MFYRLNFGLGNVDYAFTTSTRNSCPFPFKQGRLADPVGEFVACKPAELLPVRRLRTAEWSKSYSVTRYVRETLRDFDLRLQNQTLKMQLY